MNESQLLQKLDERQKQKKVRNLLQAMAKEKNSAKQRVKNEPKVGTRLVIEVNKLLVLDDSRFRNSLFENDLQKTAFGN